MSRMKDFINENDCKSLILEIYFKTQKNTAFWPEIDGYKLKHPNQD